MKVNITIRYYTTMFSWLCFRHATQAAANGQEVLTELDDFNSDYYMGTTQCVLCSPSSALGATT